LFDKADLKKVPWQYERLTDSINVQTQSNRVCNSLVILLW
jgi:hypothetical protein